MKPEHCWHRNKSLTREIVAELRSIWLAFDPLGVIDEQDHEFHFDDEYDSYIGGTLTALKNEDQRPTLLTFIKLALDHMGIGDGFVLDDEIQEFADKLQVWFATVEKRTLEVTS